MDFFLKIILFDFLSRNLFQYLCVVLSPRFHICEKYFSQ